MSQDVTPPLEPVLNYISVDTANNDVAIFWKKSPSPDVAGYNLYYEVKTPNNYEGLKFASVTASTTSYTDTSGLAGNKSVLYSISAVDFSGNESTRTAMHSTIYATVVYDSCNARATLYWNKYIGWGNNIGGGYEVYARRGMEAFQKIAGKDAGTDSMVIFKIGADDEILENNQYQFFVVGVQNDNLYLSSSNIVSKFTLMPVAPKDFHLDYVTVTGPRSIDLKFRYSEASTIDSFAIFRSNQENSEFVKIKSFPNTNSPPQIIEDSVFTNINRFYYRIGAINNCGVAIDSGTSNMGLNIMLSGKDTILENKQFNILNWSAYRDFPEGIEAYELYRIGPGGDTLYIPTTDPLDTSYIDDLAIIYGLDFSGKLTYLVKAIENGKSNAAYSNFREIFVRTDIWVPNAFTPNGDNKNDVFKPNFNLTPDKYLMMIYNRFGTTVFSTEDPLVGWDGKVGGNNYAPEGVYIYHVQYTSFNGQAGNKTGSVTVFYP